MIFGIMSGTETAVQSAFKIETESIKIVENVLLQRQSCSFEPSVLAFASYLISALSHVFPVIQMRL